MTTYSDASIVRIPSLPDASSEDVWGSFAADPSPQPALEPRPSSRRSGATLTVLALVAGIGALALGVLAVVLAASSQGDGSVAAAAAPVPRAQKQQTNAVERRALALLAKPSTERIAFRGSGGELVLAVGSGGKAAILVRGLELAAAERPYRALLLGAGKPVRVAQFTGAEDAVFLTAPVARGSSVAVATERATALRSGWARLIATRG
jgi:hypothetical protein